MKTCDKLATTTVTPARLRVFQPSQRPIMLAAQGEWVETPWGQCRVHGRLGQRHADLYEGARWCAEESRRREDGGISLLVDPAKLRRALGDGAEYSHQRLWVLLREIMSAVVEIKTRDIKAVGHLIDEAVESTKNSRPDPLTGQMRPLWVIRLGSVAAALDRQDLPLSYDPRPLVRLQFGISQAVARHCLTHRQEPHGGWMLDRLIEVVAGPQSEQGMCNARHRLRKDAAGMLTLGLLIQGERVRRISQRPGGISQRPGAFHSGPVL